MPHRQAVVYCECQHKVSVKEAGTFVSVTMETLMIIINLSISLHIHTQAADIVQVLQKAYRSANKGIKSRKTSDSSFPSPLSSGFEFQKVKGRVHTMEDEDELIEHKSLSQFTRRAVSSQPVRDAHPRAYKQAINACTVLSYAVCYISYSYMVLTHSLTHTAHSHRGIPLHSLKSYEYNFLRLHPFTPHTSHPHTCTHHTLTKGQEEGQS